MLRNRQEADPYLRAGDRKHLANARRDEFEGEVAAQSGNWKMTLAFSERSYQQKPDLSNGNSTWRPPISTRETMMHWPFRFYIDLVDRGQYTAHALPC